MGPRTAAAASTGRSAAVRARRESRLAVLGLALITAVWGSTFLLIKDAVADVPVADYLGVRFVIAAAAVLALAPRAMAGVPRRALVAGALLGGVYGSGQLLQAAGLQTVAASVSGFLTGLCVVLTPVLGALLLRERIGRPVLVAVVLATAGLAVLSLRGWSLGTGELLTLASAVVFALHVVGLSRFAVPGSVIGFAQAQLLGTAAVCLLAALPGGVALPGTGAAWTSLLYTALVAGAVAMVVQTWAQARLSAARTALLLTLEPVYAAGFAVGLGGEPATWRLAVGGALVLLAMVVSEWRPSAPAATVLRVLQTPRFYARRSGSPRAGGPGAQR